MALAIDALLNEARLKEWKAHWPLVLSSAIGLAFFSTMTFSLGLFIEPLTEEFGWSRTQISVVTSIMATVAILLSPLMGASLTGWACGALRFRDSYKREFPSPFSAW